MKLEKIPIAQLISDPSNARKHSPKNLSAIKGSLAKFGQQKPIVVDSSNVVIAGNGTLEAAKSLGWTEIDIVRTDLKGAEKIAFALADNRSSELAEWDDDILGRSLQALYEEGFNIEDIGFDLGDYDLNKTEGLTPEDAIPEVEENKFKVERGQIWQLGHHRAMCGDSTSKEDVERLMNGEKADMVFTDPPYGVSYENKCNEIANQSKSRVVSKIQSDDLSVGELKIIIQSAFNNINLILAEKSCYYVCSPQGGELGLMMMMQEANIPCRHMIIWVKNAPVFSMGRLDYDYKHEPILYGWSPKRTHYKSTMAGQWKSSVWDCGREQNKVHPTMKPTALIENAIINSCPQSGNVADLFLGSGSTLIACEKTNRRCYGMEIDPHYVSVIIERWQQFTGKSAQLLS